MKTPKFFFATAMDYLGRNGDKGQVMQIGRTHPRRKAVRASRPSLREAVKYELVLCYRPKLRAWVGL